MNTCVNCGHKTDTPHCPNCGQKMEVKRVSFRVIFQEFLSKWIGFDNQFGRTVIDMLRKPDAVAHSYLKGNRVKYLGPLGYVVIMTALLIISFDIFGLEVQDFLERNQSSFEDMYLQKEMSPEQQRIQDTLVKPMNKVMAKNYRFMAAALIPFWALAMAAFYRNEKLNYVERVVIATYMACEGMWLSILAVGIFAFTGYLATIPITIISFLYYIYALCKILPQEDKFITVIKAIASLLGGFALFMVTFIIVFLVYMMSIVIQNPEMIQQQG